MRGFVSRAVVSIGRCLSVGLFQPPPPSRHPPTNLLLLSLILLLSFSFSLYLFLPFSLYHFLSPFFPFSYSLSFCCLSFSLSPILTFCSSTFYLTFLFPTCHPPRYQRYVLHVHWYFVTIYWFWNVKRNKPWVRDELFFFDMDFDKS